MFLQRANPQLCPVSPKYRPYPVLQTTAAALVEPAYANAFATGVEELFASDRTVSRLAQMQTADYWQQRAPS